jgi:hypothetical protein
VKRNRGKVRVVCQSSPSLFGFQASQNASTK